MTSRRTRKRRSGSRRKKRKARHFLLAIVLAGACLGVLLLGTGLKSSNPLLTKIALFYLLIVGALYCVWRALVLSAVAEADAYAKAEKDKS